MAMGDQRLDIILYGATGFTGEHILKRLVDEKNITYGIAGRNQARMEKLLAKVGKKAGELEITYVGIQNMIYNQLYIETVVSCQVISHASYWTLFICAV